MLGEAAGSRGIRTRDMLGREIPDTAAVVTGEGGAGAGCVQGTWKRCDKNVTRDCPQSAAPLVIQGHQEGSGTEWCQARPPGEQARRLPPSERSSQPCW